MPLPLPQDDLDLVLSLTPDFWSRFGGSRLFMTGGTGFIGTWLLQTLQRANDKLGSKMELVVLTRDLERARQQAPHVFDRPDTTLVAGDISHFADPIGKIDLCIHAATDVGDPLRAGDPLRVFDSIVLGTRRMLDLADANGASRFLLTSSGAVYGPQPVDLERMAETYSGAPHPLQPSAAYGNGKRAAEWLACAHATQASQAGFETSIARIFALIGPGLPLNGPFAAGNFVRDALAGQAISIPTCIWLTSVYGFCAFSPLAPRVRHTTSAPKRRCRLQRWPGKSLRQWARIYPSRCRRPSSPLHPYRVMCLTPAKPSKS
jgi:nucleoside-diphosphate-sugar epimerase